MSLDSLFHGNKEDEFYAAVYRAPAEISAQSNPVEMDYSYMVFSYVSRATIGAVTGFLAVPCLAGAYAVLAGKELELISTILDYPTLSSAAPFVGAIAAATAGVLTTNDRGEHSP